MENNFVKTALKNKVGYCRVEIELKIKDFTNHKKKLNFYIAYLEEKDTLYIVSLDFVSIRSIPLWSKIHSKKYSKEIQKEIYTTTKSLVDAYVGFFMDNFNNKKLLNSFNRCISNRLLLSFYFMRIKSFINRLKYTNNTTKNDSSVQEYENYRENNWKLCY